MTAKKRTFWLLVLAGALQLLLAAGPQSAWAAPRTDVAMFYDSLTPYGSWIDYEHYGPVWYPNKVDKGWRPYMDGRWVPTAEGWVFETSEPWGWATYHYGNWMPTSEYGWVWYPGSTWYPSTAAWRTSDNYIGWAPVPPPDYIPEPALSPETAQYYPEEQYVPEAGYVPPAAPYPAPGYAPGVPPLDYLGAPFWIFTEALNFLLGFGQPYAPAYSYYGCNCLSPFAYNPVAFGGTFLLTDFYSPFYARNGFYCYGPPFPFVSRVTNVNIVNINNYANNFNFTRIRNGLPPQEVFARHPFFRDSIPAAVREGHRFEINRAENITQAERRLSDPRALAAPKNIPAISGQIPKVMAGPGTRKGGVQQMKGMQFPRQAETGLSPQMRKQIQVQKKIAGTPRIETKPEFRPTLKGGPGGQPPGGPGTTTKEISPTFKGAPQREIRPTAPTKEISPKVTTPQKEYRTVTPQRQYSPGPSGTFTPTPRAQYRATPTRTFTPSIPNEFRAAPRPQFQAAPRPQFQGTPRVTTPAPPSGGPAPRQSGGGATQFRR